MPTNRTLFLSYARGDDQDKRFAATLHRKREDAGFPAWWDQVDLPSRSLTFLHEIRRAIDTARRVLVVIGFRAAESAYVRAEWQHALKVVIPLLRVGAPETAPPELRPLQFVDVQPGRPFTEAWTGLLSDLECAGSDARRATRADS